MSVREDIATAASTVEGIKVQPYYTQATIPGSGMVRLDRIDYPNVFGGIVTWQLIIMLPSDVAAAERYIETKIPAVLDAIAPHLTVRSVTPQQITLDTGTLPVVFIQGTREEE